MPSDALILSLDGFEGPLDLLLDLARAQKIDLAAINVVALADQYLAIIEGARKIRLELAADWLVMAAWLTWLKSRLLLPVQDEAAEEGAAAADVLAARLAELERMRAAAAWLTGRPVLGQDIFTRGAPEDLTETDRSGLSVDIPSLLRGYLDAIRRVARARVYTPRQLSLNFWSVQDAMSRLAATLGRMPDWSSLEAFLPPSLTGQAHRAAVASTLLASLELARGGSLRLRQDDAFAPILISGAAANEA
jgi:segregation and condensation protein A